MHASKDRRPVDRDTYTKALAEGFSVPPPRKYDGPVVDIHTHATDLETGTPLFEAAALYGVHRLGVIARLHAGVELRRTFSAVTPVPWLEWKDADRPDRFAAVNAAIVREAARAGAPLIKMWFAPRFYDRYDVRLDAPLLDPVFEELERQGLGLLVHIADPDRWFERVYTDTSRYGTKPEQYRQLERRLAAHRNVPILVAHMGGNPENLDELGGLLDRHPNMYVDTSATRWIVRELGRQPAATRRFFQAYKDRILFGTDQVAVTDPEPYRYTSRYWIHFVFWESDAVVPLPIDDPDTEGEPLLRGVDLPADVLPWMYRRNAARVFGIDAGQT